MVALVLVLVLLAGAGFFLFVNGQEFQESAVNRRIEQVLQSFLGEHHSARIGSAGLTLRSNAILALTGKAISIHDDRSGEEVARFDEVRIKLNPLSVLSGELKFDVVDVEGGLIGIDPGNAPGFALPANLSTALSGFGRVVKSAVEPFQSGTVRRVDLARLDIALPGRPPVRIIEAGIGGKPGRETRLKGVIEREGRQSEISAVFSAGSVMGYQFEIAIGDTDFSGLVPSAETGEDVTGPIGLDGVFSVTASFPFLPDLTPGNAAITLASTDGRLRVLRKQATDYDEARINLVYYPEHDKIELERSVFRSNGVGIEFIGGVRPVSPERGFAGRLEVEMIGDRITGAPSQTGEAPVEAQAIGHGYWEPDTRRLVLDEAYVLAGEDRIDAAMDAGFGKDGSGISAHFGSEGIAVDTVKQLWPFFLARPARDWLAGNASGGRLSGVTGKVAIAGSRLPELMRGDPMRKGELEITGALSGVRFDTYGELPPLRSVKGSLALDGSHFQLDVAEASTFDASGDRIAIGPSSFVIPNVKAKPVMADLRLAASGPIGALMWAADRKPLSAAAASGIDPSALSGSGKAEVEATFAISRQPDPPKPQWRATVHVEKGASSKPVTGHEIANADIVVKADSRTVGITGKAVIDGVPAEIEMVEPGKGQPAVKRHRRIAAQLKPEQLKARGIDLGQLVDGPLSIEIVSDGAKPDQYSVDMTKADLELPWIGWRKGAGIPARASFALVEKDGTTRVSGLRLSGEKLSASGDLAIQKNRLVSADLKGVSLKGEDNFDVTVRARKGGYDIKASGKAYDARSTIKKFVRGNDSGQDGGSDVNVTANFGKVFGFGEQSMENVVLNYATSGGNLSTFEIRGAMNGGRFAGITGSRKGGTTTFEIQSRNAGATLAFADFYGKMKGGKMTAQLSRQEGGAYAGPVLIEDFTVVGEERLRALTVAPAESRDLQLASGELRKIDTSRVGFDELKANIEKGEGYLKVDGGVLRNAQIGMTFDGSLFDRNDQMNVRGTFMPFFIFSRLVGMIPLVGEIFSNGRDSGLIGITYRLKGEAGNPKMEVNPISVVAPGIFRKAFEFRN